MTNEEQDIAIALILGWVREEVEPEIGVYVDHVWRHPSQQTALYLPKYSTDPEKMREAELALDLERKNIYMSWIWHFLFGPRIVTFNNIHLTAEELFQIATVGVDIRAKAFLHSHQKWV